MFLQLIKRHKARVKKLKKKFGLNEYHVFWMGFGEGLIIGAVVAFSLLQFFN